ncbi:MAG TPA: class I SAM-dependent methyltransferase [Ktedonobacteraceae bacterium]
MSFFGWFSRRKKAHSSVAPTPQSAGVDLARLDQRTRLADTPYLLPKDAQEDNRLDYQHHVLHLSIGSHHVAPLPQELTRILDVGTGTGIWAIEMAHQYPRAQVIGVDIGTSSFKTDLPENCTLQVGNVVEKLPFPDQTFDYTHQRFLVAAIPAARWPDVIRELVRVTRPGGWVELLEINNVFQNAGPETRRLSEWITTVSAALGFDANAVPSIGRWLKEAGLQRVETQDIVVPLGEWGGRAGALLKTDLLAGFDAAKAIYCAKTSTPVNVFENLVQTVAAEWEQYHTSYTFHASYGKRAGQ